MTRLVPFLTSVLGTRWREGARTRTWSSFCVKQAPIDLVCDLHKVPLPEPVPHSHAPKRFLLPRKLVGTTPSHAKRFGGLQSTQAIYCFCTIVCTAQYSKTREVGSAGFMSWQALAFAYSCRPLLGFDAGRWNFLLRRCLGFNAGGSIQQSNIWTYDECMYPICTAQYGSTDAKCEKSRGVGSALLQRALIASGLN